ncbi:MAG: FAD-dependent oxidoreductase [Clostridia bacterium]|nr:FAD-dependent oxidoreductase [Clostridia bacterium]
MVKIMTNIFDTIIIGGGPAGVQAGIYLVRANKKVLLIHKSGIGSLAKANQIENFYGIFGASGKDVYLTGINQVKSLGASVFDEEVSSVSHDYENNLFEVSAGGKEFHSKSLILAMGKEQKTNSDFMINVNQGVSYCALCDGFFYKNKKVAVIGESEFAFAEFKHLLDVTDDVTLLLNAKAHNILPKYIRNNEESKIVEIKNGENRNVKVVFDDARSQEFDGVFIAEGSIGASAITKLLGLTKTNDGHIVVDEKMQTNINGVFACGDINGTPYQIAKAVSDGMKAGLSVINYLNK